MNGGQSRLLSWCSVPHVPSGNSTPIRSSISRRVTVSGECAQLWGGLLQGSSFMIVPAIGTVPLTSHRPILFRCLSMTTPQLCTLSNAGRSSRLSKPPKASAEWRRRHWQGWYRHITLAMLAHAVPAILRARGGKTPGGQVVLSVPELRHLLTHLLWRGWHGVEHLLHWSKWRRQHQFHALCCHHRKRGSPLPIFYLQL